MLDSPVEEHKCLLRRGGAVNHLFVAEAHADEDDCSKISVSHPGIHQFSHSLVNMVKPMSWIGLRPQESMNRKVAQ